MNDDIEKRVLASEEKTSTTLCVSKEDLLDLLERNHHLYQQVKELQTRGTVHEETLRVYRRLRAHLNEEQIQRVDADLKATEDRLVQSYGKTQVIGNVR